MQYINFEEWKEGYMKNMYKSSFYFFSLQAFLYKNVYACYWKTSIFKNMSDLNGRRYTGRYKNPLYKNHKA